jgi:stage II sporulation protein P
MFESAVYNQKYSDKAILVEFGGVDNTMEECENSAAALAWAIASVMLNTSPARP